MIFKESKTTDILFDLFKSFLSLLDKFFPKDDKLLLFPIRDNSFVFRIRPFIPTWYLSIYFFIPSILG